MLWGGQGYYYTYKTLAQPTIYHIEMESPIKDANAQPSEPQQATEPPSQPIEWLTADFTAYNSEPSQTDNTPNITANGETTHAGGIACPRNIAFDTKIELASGEIYICNDRMNARYKNRFDVWLPTKVASIKWGVKSLQYRIKD